MDAILAIALFLLAFLFMYLAAQWNSQFFSVWVFLLLLSIFFQSYNTGFSWHDASNVTTTYTYIANSSVVASTTQLQAPQSLPTLWATAFETLLLLMSLFYLIMTFRGGRPDSR